MMTEQEFDEAADAGEMDDEYSEYIMEHSKGDRIICNGDTLIRAMEDQYLWEDFRESMIDWKISEQEARIMSLHKVTLDDARSYIADMEAAQKDYQEVRDGTK